MLRKIAVLGGLVAALSFAVTASAAEGPASRRTPELDQAVKRGLQVCRWATDNCRTAINHAWAELVFPNLDKAQLGAGGGGVKGAMVEEGRITGYYTIAGGPAVPPPNIGGTSAVFVFEKDAPVIRLRSGESWTVGTTPDVRLITENTGDVPPVANVEAFVFNRGGLHAGLSLSDFHVRKTGTPQPKHQT